jgi:hypothetical protein
MSPQLAPRVIDLLLELENDIAGQRCGMARAQMIPSRHEPERNPAVQRSAAARDVLSFRLSTGGGRSAPKPTLAARDSPMGDRGNVRRLNHSPLIFAALRIGHHFSISALW